MSAPYAVRPPAETDLDEIVELIYATELAMDPQTGRYDTDEIRREWADLDLAQDAWLVVDQKNAARGYATLSTEAANGRLFGDGYTHPDLVGTGIGSLLLDLMETRAAVLAGGFPPGRVLLVNYTHAGGAGQRLLESRGYALVRVHQQMFLDLRDAQLSAPVWPRGVTVRACDGSDADVHRAYECVEDAFADHWGRPRKTFEEFASTMIYEGFDPSLWIMAERDGELIGASLCRMRDGGDGGDGKAAMGEVTMLGVLRPGRRLGLGEALLRHGFEVLRERGAATVTLGVDSESLTGADRLYARVGMSVSAQIGRFEMELRPA